MKISLRLSMAAVMAVGLTSTSFAVNWDGGGDGTSYEDGLNWADDDPTFTDLTRSISGAFTVDRDVDINVNRTFLNGGAVLNVTAGTHNDGQSGANIFNFVGDNGAGTLNVSGGEYGIGHGLRVGVGPAPDGVVNVTGGVLNVFRGSNAKFASDNPGGRPSIEIGDDSAIGGGGLLEISGGTLTTRAGVYVAPTGFFRVVGSGPTEIGIGSSGSLDGYWRQETGASLEVQVDETSTGVTPILIDVVDGGGAGGGNVVFEAGSLLDVSFTGAENQGIFTVMNWEGSVTDNGLAFAPGVDTDLWSFSVNANSLTIQAGDGPFAIPGDFDMDEDIDGQDFLKWQQDGLSAAELTTWENGYGTGGGGGLIAAVPEPTSILLLTFSGLAVFAGRRKA